MENVKDNMPAFGGSAAGGKITFKITDITCDACIRLSSMALKKIPGVKSVEVKSDGSAAVETDKKISNEEIVAALAKVEKRAVFN